MGMHADMFDVARMTQSFESARFLDLWQETREFWQDPGLALRLPVEGLLLAARLASRLGNGKYRRALLRLALQKEPDNVRVRYYARSELYRRGTLLDFLREMDQPWQGEFPNPDTEASWLSAHAITLARVRDFERAHELIQRALVVREARGYVLSTHADILLLEDRWDEALEVARHAWAASPGQPYAADTLHRALSALGREAEAVETLLQWAAAGGQSGDCLMIAIGAAISVSGRLESAERSALLARIAGWVERVPDYFPLADRHMRRAMLHQRLLLASERRDHEAIARYGPEADHPFFNAVRENLAKHPDGARVLVPHKPVRQRHNTCMPASVAAVTGAIGHELDQDSVADAVCYEGTESWRAREHARQNGLQVRCFLFTPEIARELVDRGLPFLIAFASLQYGHACGFVGYDAAYGTALIHDPSLPYLSESLMDRLAQDEAPVGPRCMLFLTPGQAADIADLPLPDEAAVEAELDVYEALNRQGPQAAMQRAQRVQGDGPMAAYVRALGRYMASDVAGSVEEFERLLATFPRSVTLQKQVLASLRRLDDTARQRKTLRSIVTGAPLPGLQGGEVWIHPRAHLLCEYAALLLANARERKQAESWLRRAMLRDPFEPEAYLQYGSLLARQGRGELALLPYRLAALLAPASDYVQAVYASELHRQGQLQAAVDWLNRRAAKYAGDAGAFGTVTVLVDKLEDFGRPEAALEVLRKARAEMPRDGDLASFAVGFFCRHGRLEEAEAALADTRQFAKVSVARAAEVQFYSSQGQAEQALESARAWHAQDPLAMSACHELLRQTEAVLGADAALELAGQWRSQYPLHDALHEMYVERLEATSRAHERIDVLRQWLKRNPNCAWTWRALASLLEDNVARSKDHDHTRKLDEFTKALRRCVATSPEHPITLRLQAELAWQEGRTEDAIEFTTQVFEADPYIVGALARALYFARADRTRGLGVIERCTAALCRQRTELGQAPRVAGIIAENFGRAVADEQLSIWEQSAPDDPHLVQARAELLLDRGGGIDALGPFAPILEDAVRRYPVHRGLRLVLAEFYAGMLRHEDAARELNALIGFAPGFLPGYRMLADVLQRMNRVPEAEQTLRLAVSRHPLMPDAHHALADLLLSGGRRGEADEVLEAACRRVPTHIDFWERRVQLAMQARAYDRAEQISAELERQFPANADALLVRARTLRSVARANTRSQVEDAFRRALSADAESFVAVDEYADFLCDQGQFITAREMVLSRRAHFADPVPVDFKVIEIDRRSQPGRHHTLRLAGLLRARPDFVYGWRTFMNWVSEEGGGIEIRQMLNALPPNLGEDVSLQCDRLEILLALGHPFEKVAEEWQRLISNMPENLEINLRWIDTLLERKRIDDADAALQIFAQHGEDRPAVLARRVVLNCRRRDIKQALDATERLCLAPGEPEGSLRYAFRELAAAHFVAAAIRRVFDLAEAGRPVSRTALLTAVDFAPNITPLLSRLNPAAAAGDAELVGAILSASSDVVGHREVLKFAASHPELCRANELTLQAVGWAYLQTGKNQDVLRWFGDWRRLPGVQMRMVHMIVCACIDLYMFDQAAKDGIEALETLPHDDSAPNVVFNTLLAHWLARDFSGFELHSSRFAHLLPKNDDLAVTLRAMGMALQLLRTESNREMMSLDWTFRRDVLPQGVIHGPIFRVAWNRAIAGKMGFWMRVWRFAKNGT